MSKPIRDVKIATRDAKTGQVNALLDTGSFFSIVRADKVPEGAMVVPFASPQKFKTATRQGTLHVTGEIPLMLTLEGKLIEDSVLVSPDLGRDMLIGAKTMQAWDISVVHSNARTEIRVGRDLRDPEITEVD